MPSQWPIHNGSQLHSRTQKSAQVPVVWRGGKSKELQAFSQLLSYLSAKLLLVQPAASCQTRALIKLKNILKNLDNLTNSQLKKFFSAVLFYISSLDTLCLLGSGYFWTRLSNKDILYKICRAPLYVDLFFKHFPKHWVQCHYFWYIIPQIYFQLCKLSDKLNAFWDIWLL